MHRVCGQTPSAAGESTWLVVRPVYGLANRLRAVMSGWVLARAHGLRFAIHWAPSMGFSDTGWRDLFDNDFELLDAESYQRILESGVPRMSRWLGGAEADGSLPVGLTGWRVRRTLRESGLVYDEGFQHIDKLLARLGARCLRGSSWRRARAYRSLRASAPIQQEVDAFAARHFAGRHVIGVHVRRGDATRGPDRDQYLRTPDEMFEAALERVVSRRPQTHFFLATDCATTQARFGARFGDRIIARGKEFVPSHDRAAKHGQWDAAVELWLLSRTRRVIGNHASSFGRCAARIGGLRFETASRSRR